MSDHPARLEMDRTLLTESDQDQLSRLAVERICQAHRARSVTMFLFSKRGRLVPAASAGELPAGAEKEEYAPGEDLVGQCAAGEPSGDRFGAMLATERPFEEASERFKTLFGPVIASNTQIAYLPLDGPNRTFGVLRVICGRNASGKERRLSAGDRSQLAVFSHQVAISLLSLRRKLELDVLAHVNKLVTDRPGDVERVYNEVTKALVEPATEFAACVIRIRDRSGHLELRSLAPASGMRMVRKDTLPRRPDTGFGGQAFETKEPVIVQEVQTRLDGFHDPDLIRDNGFATAAYFPILHEEERLGVLSLYCWYPYQFYQTKIAFLKSLCQQVATAARVVRLLESRQKLIDTVTAIVSHSGDKDELLRTVLDGACTLTGANQGYLSMIDRRAARLQPRVMTPNLAEQHIPPIDVGGKGLTALAVRTRASVRCGDVSEDDVYVDFAGDAAEKTRSEIVVPLVYEQHVLGVLALQSDQAHYFSESDEALLDALARNATLMFQHDRLSEATTALANVDFSRSSSDLMHVIARSAVEIVDADAAILRTYDRSANALVLASHHPASMNTEHMALTMARNEGASWDAFDAGDVVRFDNLRLNSTFHNPNAEFADANGFTEMVSVPLLLPTAAPEAPTPLGVINVFFRTPSPFFEIERRLLRVLGVAASYAIHDRAVIEESSRTQAVAAFTARATTAVELSSQLAHRAVTPLREARTALESIERAVRRQDPAGLPKPMGVLQTQLSRIESLVLRLAPGERGSPRPDRLTDASEVLADAFRFIHTNLFAGTGKPHLQIGETELWDNIQSALRRVLDLVRLPVAAAFLSTRRDYSDMRRVSVTHVESQGVDHIALASFDEFVWLTERAQLVLPKDSGPFAWLDPDFITSTPRAILYGHEVTGGRLLIIALGVPAERALTFEDLAALYEMVAVQIFTYIDNTMFGIELDFLTSETGHLMGRAIGKVESGARELLHGLNDHGADVDALSLAQSAIEDGINRLKLIQNNFYWFSVHRKMLGGGSPESTEPVVGGDKRVDVRGMLEGMMPLFNREASERRLKPTRFFAQNEMGSVVRGPADPLRLTFLNLYDNALKFAYANTHIEIRLWTDAGQCHVSFQNLGTGVAPDEFETVFERLRRSRYQDRSKRNEGLGLGLSYCRRVVREIFHGEISLHSREAPTPTRPYEGYNYLTTVTLKLPLTEEGGRFSA